jgi:TolB-like protein/DNA-binding winged helix-turn-helix (wHTH) protein
LGVPIGVLRFAEFELDCGRYELRRGDSLLKLEKIPMELLLLLVESKGQLVTRDEIVEKIWGKDVFVDTEHGINTAIRKIRAALSEDADKPRYIQTVQGKGYRFAAEVRNGRSTATPSVQESQVDGLIPPVQSASVPMAAAESHRLWWPVATAALILGLAAGIAVVRNVGGIRDRLSGKNGPPQIHSIAVLPLENLSGDPAQEYFADGMTDELITALAQNRALRVVSRTSAMQFKGVSKPLREIAQALGVDGILEGSVVRNADHVHMNLQLIYAPTDTHVWARSYNRDLNGAMSLPEELSDTIASEAKAASRPARQLRYVNPEAHDAYLRGRYLWVAGNYGESRKYFEKAIQLQPGYAPGWSGLSDSILAGGVGLAAARGLVEKAEAAAGKAIELDDKFAEGHHAMAAVYLFGKWDWERADAESRRSLELDPSFSEAHHLHSYILFAMNRVQEALQEQKRATEIDPFERPWALGRAYYRVRQYDAALEEFRMRAQAGSAALWVHYFLSKVYGFKGMEEESVQEMEENARINLGGEAAAQVHRAYVRGGRRAVLQLRLEDLKTRSRDDYVSPFDLAEAYADLGMKDEAFSELADAYREHSMDLVFLQQEPNFDFMHSDPRYRALVKKIGLVPAY